MDMYDKVAKEVAPKKEKLEKAEREYAQTVSILEEKKLEVVRLEKQLAQLNLKLQEANKKQGRLQKTADACNRKLERSVILITGFEDEKIKWTNQVAELDLKDQCLFGDVLLTSAFIAYLSPIPIQFRKITVDKWYNYLKDHKVPVSDNWDLTTTLISNNLSFKGVPQEKHFFENIIIHEYSQKYCLIIDPHNLAKIWIQKTFDKHWLHTTKYGSSTFIKDVRFSLETGKLLLIEKVGENISSCLNYILNKQSTKEESTEICFENERLTSNKNFRLILITTLTSPNYKTEISDKIRLIDFSITTFSIQKKLLSLVIKTENPLVSKQISIYKKKQKKNENLLKEYEDKILKTLSEAEVDLLEDNKTLKILDDSKNAYIRVNKEIYLPDKVVPTFETLEQNYTEFSHYASNIFFCIEHFCKINKNVKFCYNQFLIIFRNSILAAPLSRDPLKRIDNITYCFTYTIFRHIQRLVCSEQTLNFLFYVCCRLLMFKGVVSGEDLQFLYKTEGLTQTKILQDMKTELNQKKNCDTREVLNKLEYFKDFKSLVDSIRDNQNLWEPILNKKDPENQRLPQPFQQNLNDFQKFTLIQTLRPDRTKECTKKLISNLLNEKYTLPLEVDLEQLYAESFCLSPILFLTTNNSSPLEKIKSFAVQKKFHNKFAWACIIEGGNLRAEQLIRDGQSEGRWVCLLNCHLSKTWKYDLERICEVMTFENTNENFRLWLISDVSFDLPSEFQEKCVRIVYGSADSFKDDLLGTYKDFVDDIDVREYQNYDQKTVRLLYRLICFHNVMLWRTKYTGNAWDIPFNFSDYDLRFSLKLLPKIIEIYGNNEAIYNLIGESLYCGQFLNEVDYTVAKTLFNEFLSLEDSSSFSLPSKNDTHDFIAHIVDKFPSNEVPEIFGFNEVSLRRKNMREKSYFISYISSMDSTWNNHKEYEEIKKIVETSYNLIDVEMCIENRTEKILDTVLKQEVNCYNILREHIMKYLKILSDILNNNKLLSAKLTEILKDLIQNKIPKKFLKYSFITNKTYSSFVLSLRSSLLYLKNWCDNGMPESIRLSVFFHPNSILTAYKMEYSDKISRHLTEFKKLYEIDTSKDSVAFKIEGLFLVNAKLNESTGFLELLPENVYYYKLPTLCIRPVIEKKECFYNCPVYRIERGCSEQFGNSIFFIELASSIPLKTLIKLGVYLTFEEPEKLND